MKKSRILLLSGGGVVFLAMLALMIYFRIVADDFIASAGDSESYVEASGVQNTKEYSIEDFDKLYFENMWDVSIREGNDFSIEVSADKALFDEMEVVKRGRTVYFSYDKYIQGLSERDRHVRVEITMPDIKEIVFSGMGNIDLNEFDLEELTVNNSGASNIEAHGVSIKQLNLVINGAANAQLDNIDIENCHLDISGAANIELHMTGGRLTGQVSGAASVSYGGSVSDESVIVSGIGSLERR